MTITVCGVLNCTPDSFSDGDLRGGPDSFILRGRELIRDGAQIVEIGGDSTRPKSQCVGPEEEWRRIGPVVKELSREIPVSIDTHHPWVAESAIEHGASFINDVSGGSNLDLVKIVAASNVTYIVMFSATGIPHSFGAGIEAERVREVIDSWFVRRIETLGEAGIPRHRLILDTGLGAFVSPDPATSWALLGHYHHFARFGCALMVGCSRKGFLAEHGEGSVSERDGATAFCGALVAERLQGRVPLYLRVHNVVAQRRFLNILEKLPSG